MWEIHLNLIEPASSPSTEDDTSKMGKLQEHGWSNHVGRCQTLGSHVRRSYTLLQYFQRRHIVLWHMLEEVRKHLPVNTTVKSHEIDQWGGERLVKLKPCKFVDGLRVQV